MVRRVIPVLSLTALFAVACRTPVPRQEIVPEPPPPPPPVVKVTDGPWSWLPVRERRAYTVTQRALITTRQDTLARVDTVTSELGTAFTQFVQANRISGSLTSYRVSSGARAATTPAGVTLPVTLAAISSGSAMPWTMTAPAESNACTAAAPSAANTSALAWTIAQGVRELWFRAPDTLRVGTRWSDSTSYTSCRDGIPLRLQVRRDFRVSAVAEREGRAVLTVLRETRTTLTGEGTQFGETVRFTGSGTGSLQYEIEPASGEMLGGAGTSALEFTMQSRLRTQRVQQAAVVTIVRGS